MTTPGLSFRLRAIRVGRWLFADLRQLIAVVLLVATGWMIYDEAFRAWDPNRWRPAIAVESPVFAQVCGAHGSWHVLLIWDGIDAPWRLYFERRSYLGNAGYHHSTGIESRGFAFVVLPHRVNDGDYILDPYAAVALPYWFVAVGNSAWLAWRLRKRRPLLSTESALPPTPV